MLLQTHESLMKSIWWLCIHLCMHVLIKKFPRNALQLLVHYATHQRYVRILSELSIFKIMIKLPVSFWAWSMTRATMHLMQVWFLPRFIVFAFQIFPILYVTKLNWKYIAYFVTVMQLLIVMRSTQLPRQITLMDSHCTRRLKMHLGVNKCILH